MANSYGKNKGRNKLPGGFAGIPRIVLKNQDYINLPSTAKVLLVELAFQYRGHNNGDLTTAWGVLNKRGFKSKATLSRATKALLDANLIIQTRKGIFMNPGSKCSLYALTWLAIDECPGKRLEINQTSTPPRKFSFENKMLVS